MCMKREKIRINGIVQGVGFRPHVYRLAKELTLCGYVSNNSEGVVIEIEGEKNNLESFHSQLKTAPPPLAQITDYRIDDILVCHDVDFKIQKSSHITKPTTFISPDIATCDDCLEELFDANDRRYKYPFINCTNCGPRYTIIKGTPYDRTLTSMSEFPLCSNCQTEYDDPSNRRFHAQPNACSVCGPQLSLHDGTSEMSTESPIEDVISLLQDGKIIAIKGIGGFHLAVDSNNSKAIEKLRDRKGRAEKPFAMMSRDIQTIQKYCYVSKQESELLISNKRPIVLMEKKGNCTLQVNIAPKNKMLGFMLAYSPLHHLLLQNNFDTLVMTSANLSEEPIAIDNHEAIERLSSVADYFLLHNRNILQRCDDSIVRVVSDYTQIIRRSRGFVPSPHFINKNIRHCVLAVGGELKNSIAFSRENNVFMSQYIGDLDNPKAYNFFEDSISHFSKILEAKPTAIAYDLHPEYLSTKWAKKQTLPTIAIQHHHAHMVSVMAENNYYDKTIGIILDGTGFGTDGTIWGGEILVGDALNVERFCSLKQVALPGGTVAIKEPWRMALSCLYSAYGNKIPENIPFMRSISKEKTDLVCQMIEKKINSPLTSSCGRLFDAVSALLNIKHAITYDAQAAIELENIANSTTRFDVQPIKNVGSVIDTDKLIRKIVEMIQENKPTAQIALYFHYQLAEYFVAAVLSAREKFAIDTVALSGGVYQNKLFFEYISLRLQNEKFNLLTHKELPTNDGGLALGQIMIADAQLSAQKKGV